MLQIHHLAEKPSLLLHFLNEIRNVAVQNDKLRFRKNLERIGEILALEISKNLEYQTLNVSTPLGNKSSFEIKDEVVVCSILRAGLALHQGFINYFDHAEHGFISAYRNHFKNDNDFRIEVEYQAMPSIQNKSLLLVDPMLATGQSLIAVLNQIHLEEKPKEVHLAVVVASPEGIEYLKQNICFPCHLWIADIDEKLNDKNYIIPGLGDAGDLAYGIKL